MTSIQMRANPLFTRNGFATAGDWQIPLVERQNIDLSSVELIAYSRL